MTEILFKEECYAIRGACFNVYKDKWCGFLEPVYHECCEIEFSFQQIPFVSQKELQLTYRGQALKQRYKPDLSATIRSLSSSRQYRNSQTSAEHKC